HGAATHHLLLLVGAQCFRPSGNPRRINADIVGVDRAEGADVTDVVRCEATGRIGVGISIAVRVLGGRGTGEEDGEAAGANRDEDDVLHLLVISLVRRYEGRFRERKMKIGSFAESINNQTELRAGGATALGSEERAQLLRDTFDSHERMGLVRAQNAALIASEFRYSLSLNKAHSKHRA